MKQVDLKILLSKLKPVLEKLQSKRRYIFVAIIAIVAGGGYYFMNSGTKVVVPIRSAKAARTKSTKKPPAKDPNSQKKDQTSEDSNEPNALSISKENQTLIAKLIEESNDPNKIKVEPNEPIDIEITEEPELITEEGWPDPNAITPVINYTEPNKPVGIQSLVFMKDMDIQDALHLLAATYKKNIVPSLEVTGKLAFLNLYDVTFDEAMEAILGSDYKYEETGNLVKVFATEKARMIHKVFTLYYINAAEAKKLVSQVLSDKAKIEVTTAAQAGVPVDSEIAAHNDGGDATAMNDAIIIYDYPENIEKAQQVLESVDIRPKQVLIEATILSATINEGMQFGIDWQTIKGVAINELTDLDVDTPGYFGSTGTGSKVGTDSLTGGLTIGFVLDDVASFIRAVEEVTDITVLANTKILAVNKQLGEIYIGKKIAYQSQTTQSETSTTEQVQFLETGTKLSFRPFIGDDNYIRMDVHPKDSSATLRSSGTSTLPDETSAELVTNIIVRDCETIIIGGLFRDRITTSTTQVPLLGDLPILGFLFRGKADEVKREEVIVLLTPHIINEPNETQALQAQKDIQRKIWGAEDGLQSLNKIKRARQFYDKAARQYLEGDNSNAIKNLDSAIRLYPSYLEAIKLKEMILREMTLEKLNVNGIR